MPAWRLLSGSYLTHMTSDVRCLIYTRISKDRLGDQHGVANQLADLDKRAQARRWTVVYRLSDNDIGATRKDPTRAGRSRPGWEEALRLVDAGAVDVVLCWRWDRALREPLDLEYLIPRFDKAGVRFAEADGIIDLGTDSGWLAVRILPSRSRCVTGCCRRCRVRRPRLPAAAPGPGVAAAVACRGDAG